MSALSRLGSTVIDELKHVLELIDDEEFCAAADLIEEASRIFVIGVGREGLAARAFAMRLMHLGFEVHIGWDDTTPSVGPGDVLVMVNGSGQIGHLDYVFSKVVITGARTLVVTGVPEAETPRLATRVLSIPATVYLGKGDLVASVQPMGSLFEQSALIVFDLIILEIIDRQNITFSDMSRRHRNFE